VTLPVAWERVVELCLGQRPTDAPGLRLYLEVHLAHLLLVLSGLHAPSNQTRLG
jgi:hypothetical protein